MGDSGYALRRAS